MKRRRWFPWYWTFGPFHADQIAWALLIALFAILVWFCVPADAHQSRRYPVHDHMEPCGEPDPDDDCIPANWRDNRTEGDVGHWYGPNDPIPAPSPHPNPLPSTPQLEKDIDTYIFTVTTDDLIIRSVARSDGECPIGCDSTVRVEIPTRGINDVYRARTSIRSTGQLTIELEE